MFRVDELIWAPVFQAFLAKDLLLSLLPSRDPTFRRSPPQTACLITTFSRGRRTCSDWLYCLDARLRRVVWGWAGGGGRGAGGGPVPPTSMWPSSAPCSLRPIFTGGRCGYSEQFRVGKTTVLISRTRGEKKCQETPNRLKAFKGHPEWASCSTRTWRIWPLPGALISPQTVLPHGRHLRTAGTRLPLGAARSTPEIWALPPRRPPAGSL